MIILWLCLIFFLVYYAFMVVYGLRAYPTLLAAIRDGRLKRTELYARLVAGQAVWVLIVLLLMAFGVIAPADVGLWPKFFDVPRWLTIASAVLAGLYLVYLVLSLIGLRRNAKNGVDNSARLPEKMKPMFPVTRREKRAWALTAVAVGFTEELVFRGFLMYLLGALFPGLPLAVILVFVSLLFGAGHLYQGLATALQPTLIGLLYGVFYVAFGTLLPCMALHMLQDLGAMYAVDGNQEVAAEQEKA